MVVFGFAFVNLYFASVVFYKFEPIVCGGQAPAFGASFLSRFPVVEPSIFLTIKCVVVVTPALRNGVVLGFKIYVLCSPYVVANDDSAVNFIISFV